MAYIKNAPWIYKPFTQISEDALVNKLKQLQVMEIDAGMEIPMHGNIASHIPLGEEGSVRVFGRDDSGHEADLYEVKPGVACMFHLHRL